MLQRAAGTSIAGLALALACSASVFAFELQDLQPGTRIEALDKVSIVPSTFYVHVVRCKHARRGEDPRGLVLDRAGAWFLKTTSATTAQARLHPRHAMAIDAARDLIQYQGSVSRAKAYPHPSGTVPEMRRKR